MISIILVQHNNVELTRAALESLKESQRGDYETILVDNASTGFDERAFRMEFPELLLLRNAGNEGFGKANNRAAKEARGRILLFLNNDTLCRVDFLSHIEQLFSGDQRIGVAGPRLVNLDGSFQLSAGWLPSFWKEAGDKVTYGLLRRNVRLAEQWIEARYQEPKDVGWVTGAALFIDKALFERLGGFDEGLFMYYEDKDLCKRALDEGRRVVYDPGVSIIHLKGGSSPAGLTGFLARVYRDSQRRYYARHRNRLERFLLRLYLNLAGHERHD